jgi:TonB family protein
MTAPVSPGSSGGGLFDEAGLLIGITTAYIEENHSASFAVPVDWIIDTLESEYSVDQQPQLDERARQPKEMGRQIEESHREQMVALERELRAIESREWDTELRDGRLAHPGTRDYTDGSATSPQPPDNNDGADALSQALSAIADRIGPKALRANPEHRSARYRLRLSPLSGLIFFARQLESSGDEELDRTIRRELYAAEPLPLPAAPELRETLKEIDVTISANNRIHVGLPGEALPFATYALSSDGTTSPTAIDDGLLDRFALEIESRVKKVVQQRGEQVYPRIARDREWEGTARVVVEYGINGWLKRVSVAETSGYAVLDQRAVEMVQEVLPNVPRELHSHGFTVRLAIIFTFGTSGANAADSPSK